MKLKTVGTKTRLATMAATVGVSALSVSAPAHAAGLTGIVDSLTNFFHSLGVFAIAGAFLLGIASGLMTIHYLRELGNQQRPPGTAMKFGVYLLATGLLLGFGGFLTMTQQTATGSSNTTSQSIQQSDFGM